MTADILISIFPYCEKKSKKENISNQCVDVKLNTKMTSQKHHYRRRGDVDVFDISTTEAGVIVAVVLSACLVSLASATLPDNTLLIEEQVNWNVTTTSVDEDEDSPLTTLTEADPVTTADMYITTQNDPGRYDGVAVTSAYDYDATEVPTTMTTDSDVDGRSPGWEDPSDTFNGRQNDVDQLAEDRDMMWAFYERYNSTTTEVDLVFVLDRSGSVPRNGWQFIVQFVKVSSLWYSCTPYNCHQLRTSL